MNYDEQAFQALVNLKLIENYGFFEEWAWYFGISAVLALIIAIFSSSRFFMYTAIVLVLLSLFMIYRLHGVDAALIRRGISL